MNWQSQTLEYYNENAAAFITGTAEANLAATRRRFLEKLMTSEPPYILDFGCGSGRDTLAFLEAGCRVDATDGSEEICRQASAMIGIDVQHMLFQNLDAEDKYDGIWACASILHLPKAELIEVLGKIARALKPQGVLYTSFKYGDFEGIKNGRYFTDFTESSLQGLMAQVPALSIEEQWITHDVRPGREEERWINILARRV